MENLVPARNFLLIPWNVFQKYDLIVEVPFHFGIWIFSNCRINEVFRSKRKSVPWNICTWISDIACKGRSILREQIAHWLMWGGPLFPFSLGICDIRGRRSPMQTSLRTAKISCKVSQDCRAIALAFCCPCTSHISTHLACHSGPFELQGDAEKTSGRAVNPKAGKCFRSVVASGIRLMGETSLSDS